MKIIFEARSSIILYNFLTKISQKKPFLLPSNICPIVLAIFFKAKFPFEIIDISLDTLEIDKTVILEKLKKTPNAYSGMLWLRSYGVKNNNEDLFESIKNINSSFVIIDDRCLMKPKFDHTFKHSDLIIYSTGYSKFIDYDWGGFGFINNKVYSYHSKKLIFNNNHLSELNKSFKYCMEKGAKYDYSDSKWLGGALKLDYGSYKNKILDDLPNISKHKKRINSLYLNNIPKQAQLPSNYHDWRFNILVNNKVQFLKTIFDEKLFASNHYYPITKLINYGYAPNSEKLFNHVINLFNDKRYTESMAMDTINIVNKHLEKWGIPEL